MKNKIFNLISVLFSLMMINSGLNKIFNYIPVPTDLPEAVVRDNAALMEVEWLMPLIAAVEIIGGLLIILPRTRAIGALMIFPILAGIVLVHATVAQAQLPIALIMAAIWGWMMYEYRDRYLQLVKK